MFGSKKVEMPTPENALPGRESAVRLSNSHFVNGNVIRPPFPQGTARVVFGMGCFWGAERMFWPLDGVYTTAVGYGAGNTPNPSYEEVCSGRTGHNEVALVVYDPEVASFEALLKVFWEGHDPTQGMRQGTMSARSTAPASTSRRPTKLSSPRRRATVSRMHLRPSGSAP